MAVNVRCTSDACRIFINHGIGAARCGQPSAAHPDATALAFHHHYSPCGWRGERYTHDHDKYLPPAYEHRLNPAWVAAVTAKPCPRCDGRVVLTDPLGSGGTAP